MRFGGSCRLASRVALGLGDQRSPVRIRPPGFTEQPATGGLAHPPPRRSGNAPETDVRTCRAGVRVRSIASGIRCQLDARGDRRPAPSSSRAVDGSSRSTRNLPKPPWPVDELRPLGRVGEPHPAAGVVTEFRVGTPGVLRRPRSLVCLVSSAVAGVTPVGVATRSKPPAMWSLFPNPCRIPPQAPVRFRAVAASAREGSTQALRPCPLRTRCSLSRPVSTARACARARGATGQFPRGASESHDPLRHVPHYPLLAELGPSAAEPRACLRPDASGMSITMEGWLRRRLVFRGRGSSERGRWSLWRVASRSVARSAEPGQERVRAERFKGESRAHHWAVGPTKARRA
jgi:hypothetical protein